MAGSLGAGTATAVAARMARAAPRTIEACMVVGEAVVMLEAGREGEKGRGRQGSESALTGCVWITSGLMQQTRKECFPAPVLYRLHLQHSTDYQR